MKQDLYTYAPHEAARSVQVCHRDRKTSTSRTRTAPLLGEIPLPMSFRARVGAMRGILARRTPSDILIGIAWVFLASGVALGALKPETKIAPGLGQHAAALKALGREDERIPIIVQTWSAPSSSERAEVERLGGSADLSFVTIHGFPAMIPARAMRDLATHPRVKHISFDAPVSAHLDTAAISTGAAEAASRFSLTGRGVAVAVFDSGVEPSADFGTPDNPTVATEIDIVEPDGRHADLFGHGTHVAGIIAGSGLSSSGAGSFRTFRGIAPGARIVSVKVLSAEGSGSVSGAIYGIDWVMRNHELYGIRVMNLSLGHPVDESYTTDPLCQAVEIAWRSGIVVVASAGNLGGTGYATVTSPANDPAVISVGAAQDWGTPETTDDLVAPFSSRGPTAIDGVIKPDILAPGTGISSIRSAGSFIDNLLEQRRVRLSDFLTVPTVDDGDSPFISLSGTSAAAAIVSGAAAILLEQDPNATPDDIKARLMMGARKIDDAIVARGAGLLDIGASLAFGATGVKSLGSPSPRLIVAREASGPGRVDVQEIGVAWGDPATWSSQRVWGDPSIWGVSAQWSDAGVWSDIVLRDATAPGPESETMIWAHP